MKSCRICKQRLPISAFSLKKNSFTIMATACDTCRLKPAVTWGQRNPEKMALSLRRFQLSGGARRGRLKAKYGLTETEYEALLAAQGGVCAICGAPEPGGLYKPLHIDHCHASKKVRGLLCTNCNRGLGYFGDDPSRLRIAATYVSS